MEPIQATRRPSGFHATNFSRLSPTAAFYSTALELELVSIAAFKIMHLELSAYGAPSSILARIAEAEVVKRQHTSLLRGIVREVGGIDSGIEVSVDRPLRSLEDIAIENVVEGCVRESFGARVAAVQAERVLDPRHKKVFATIASDELNHAELAWAVHDWIRPYLGAAGATRVEVALLRAIDDLWVDATANYAKELEATAGLPSPTEMRTLLGELEQKLWCRDRVAA